jgi:hypothetical protein
LPHANPNTFSNLVSEPRAPRFLDSHPAAAAPSATSTPSPTAADESGNLSAAAAPSPAAAPSAAAVALAAQFLATAARGDASASEQPESPSAGSSHTLAATPLAVDLVPAPGHGMITRLRENTRREKKYIDGTVRYNPYRWALFAAPVSHLDALREPAWHSAMSYEFSALSQTNMWTLVPCPWQQHCWQ